MKGGSFLGLIVLFVLLTSSVMGFSLEDSPLFELPFSIPKAEVHVVEEKVVPLAEGNPEPSIETRAGVEAVVQILITNKGFDPKESEAQIGQKVVFINVRERLTALVVGTQENNKMKSPFLAPGESFEWVFEKEGRFSFIDGVIIGTTGRVVVHK